MPFYAGLTLDEIGGARRALAGARRRLGARRRGAAPTAAARRRRRPRPSGLRARRSRRRFWGGPETEHSPSLRFLATGPRAELSVEDARAAGVDTGDEVRLSAGGESVVAALSCAPASRPAASSSRARDLPDGPVEIRPARGGSGGRLMPDEAIWS